MGDRLRIVTVGDGCAGIFRLRRLRHVLGRHQPLDELHRAVLADGDDAARHREIFAPEDSTGLDGALDLVEADLGGLGLGQQLFRPLVVVELGEFGLAGFELRDLGLLLVRRRAGLRLDAAVAGSVVPRDLDHGRGPLPAGRQLVGGGLELARGQLLQQHRVLEPDAALVIPGEQVAEHGAAGGLVGLDPDETGDRRGAGHPLLGEQSLHLPGRRAVALSRHLLPDCHLALAVGSDGEGLQHLQVDLIGAVGVQQLRRGVAESQALLDQPLRQAETCRDGRDRLPGLHQLREGDDLVGRVHRDPHDILRERDLAGVVTVGSNQTGDGVVCIDRILLDQRLHGSEAAPAGDHGVAVGSVLSRLIGADDEVLQQSEGGDRGLELDVGAGIGRGLADILGGKCEPAQRDLPDERFGPGGDVVHASLHGGLHRRGGDGLAGRPAPAPVRLLSGSRRNAGQPPGVAVGGVAARRGSGGPRSGEWRRGLSNPDAGWGRKRTRAAERVGSIRRSLGSRAPFELRQGQEKNGVNLGRRRR